MFRRDFLIAAWATAAVSAAGKIRIGLLGTQHSHAGGKLKVLLDSPDYEVAGVCEPDVAARNQRQGETLYKGQRWLSEEELLTDRSIAVVAVESAVWDFMPFGRKVITAGKHLHLEKPPTPRMAEFRELVEEARTKKLLLQTGYIWRFHAGFAAAMEAARQGWLGDVYMLRGTINTDIDTKARAGVGRYAGGMMYELGSHLIDRVVDLWGRPKNVKSWLRHDTRIPDKLADNTLAVLEYEKSLAVISTSARMPGASQHRSIRADRLGGSDRNSADRAGNPDARQHAGGARSVPGGLAGHRDGQPASIRGRLPRPRKGDPDRRSVEVFVRL